MTLIYTDNPMFINPYGPRRPLAMMKQEPYPTNQAAWARVRALWGRDDVHNPFILKNQANLFGILRRLRECLAGMLMLLLLPCGVR